MLEFDCGKRPLLFPSSLPIDRNCILEIVFFFVSPPLQKMLRVKEEELSLRERRENSHHRRRRYSEDYDSEAELYQQYRAAGLGGDLVSRFHVNPPLILDF